MMKNGKVQLPRPPVTVGPAAGTRGSGLWGAAVEMGKGAFAACAGWVVFHVLNFEVLVVTKIPMVASQFNAVS
jgi:hypothetical protein